MRDVLGVKELKIRTQTLTNPYQQKYFYQKKEEKLNCVCLKEIEKDLSYEANKDFNKFFDERYEILLMLEKMRRF